MSEETHVYLVTNKVNGKQYVGITNDFGRRWKEHVKVNDKSSILPKAINKYGQENFTYAKIITCPTREQAFELETCLIDDYGTLSPFGYNICPGGEAGPDCSKPCTIDGIYYPSYGAAALALGVGRDHIRLLIEKQTELGIEDIRSDFFERRFEVEIEGVVYKNYPEAAKAYGLEIATLRKRLKDGIPLNRPVVSGNAKEVNVDMITFPSELEASRRLGVPQTTLCRRLKKQRERGLTAFVSNPG